MTTKTYYVFTFRAGGVKNYFTSDENGNKFEPLSTFARLEDMVKTAKKHDVQLDIPDSAIFEKVRARYIPSNGIDIITLAELIEAEKSLSPS